MQAGLRIEVFPTNVGGIHVTVTTYNEDDYVKPKKIDDVISVALEKSPHVATHTDLRLWVNAVVRLVARTLEDDLYESWKVTTLPNRSERNDS